MKKFASIALAACMMLSLLVPTYAAEINANGGSGNTPVFLSSTDTGTLDGKPAATAMSVTVPTSLPMAMAQNGDVTTATDCKIINNSYGAVRVKSVTINRLAAGSSRRSETSPLSPRKRWTVTSWASLWQSAAAQP